MPKCEFTDAKRGSKPNLLSSSSSSSTSLPRFAVDKPIALIPKEQKVFMKKKERTEWNEEKRRQPAT
jgi:hypothetical protein